MAPLRNLRWVGLGLAGLLGLAVLAIWLARPNKPAAVPEAPQKEEQTVAEPVKFEPPQRLVPGQPVERELKGGQGHAYDLALGAGEYVHLVVEQKGIDVAVDLKRPDGSLMIHVDSPNGSNGPEPVHGLAEAAGLYRVEVGCADKNAALGHYEVKVVDLRPATETDRKRVRAEQQFAEAEELRRKGSLSFPEALEQYRAVLAVWQELADSDREADTLDRIGKIQRDRGESEEALAAFRKAAPLFHNLGRKTEEGIALDFIGSAYYLRGDFAEAGANHRSALEIFRDLGRPDLVASAENGLGNAHAALGETQQALESFQAALQRSREAGTKREEGIALFGIGDLLVSQGKLESALDTLQQALRLHESTGSRRNQANTLRRMANVYQRLGRLEDARSRLGQALALYESLQDLDGEAVTLNSVGTVELLSQKTEDAGKAYQKALAVFRKSGNRHGEAFALLNLGRYDFAMGNDRDAVKSHEAAAELFRAIKNRPGEVSTLFGSARALHRLGDYKAAHERLERVLADVELLRNESGSVDLRTGYFETKQHYYDLLIDVLMHLHGQEPGAGWDAKALSVHERRRARGMLDFLAAAGVNIRRGVDPALLNQEKNLEQRLAAVNPKVLEARERKNDELADALERQQRELLRELDTARTEIRSRSPRYATLTRPEPLSVPEIQSRVLGDSSLLLVYCLGEERSFLWCIPHRGKITSYILPTRKWIEDAARKAHEALSTRGRKGVDSRWLSELSKVLLRPVRDSLGDYRLLVVADGALESVPFAALPDPRAEGSAPAPLVARHEIVYLPSASVMATLRKELGDRTPAPRRIAVIADPVFSPDDARLKEPSVGTSGQPERSVRLEGALGRAVRDFGATKLDRLPFTAEEARVIREMVPGDLRFEAMGFEANKATVTSGKLRRYRVLHFATHGLLNAKHPELSGLVLSLVDEEGHPQDGFLRGYEICDLDLPAELAVLSACETGLGTQIRGEGLVGLTRSFMYAGVPRIVVSLWNVSDQGTARLMERFYRGLFRENLRPAKALRCAQLALIEEGEPWNDPYFWSAFVFQGEWRLETGSPDDGIETQVGGSQTGVRSDDDLPPPMFTQAAGCPHLG